MVRTEQVWRAAGLSLWEGNSFGGLPGAHAPALSLRSADRLQTVRNCSEHGSPPRPEPRCTHGLGS